MDERADPLPCGHDAVEWPARIGGTVLERLEEAFAEGIVIAARGPAERWYDAELLQCGQHGGALHRTAVIGVQHNLLWRDVFPLTNIPHHLACQLAAFRFIDLPADDLAAVDVHEQVQIEVDPHDRCRQIRYVPAEQLAGCRCRQCMRLVARFRRLFGATVLELVLRFQHAIEGRLRGDVLPLIDQPRHDLAWR